MDIAIATIKTKLRIFPTPRYARTRKIDKDRDAISPRRDPTKTRENVKSKARNTSMKKSGTTPKVSGSTKYIIPLKINQSRTVIKSVGKKFLRLRICCCRFFLCMGYNCGYGPYHYIDYSFGGACCHCDFH